MAVAAVDDLVSVAAGRLLALERDDGSVRWTYGDEDGRIRSATVVDGVASVATREGVAAVAGGEERWSRAFDSNAWLRDVALVEHGNDVHALDADDGDERGVATDLEGSAVAPAGSGPTSATGPSAHSRRPTGPNSGASRSTGRSGR